MTSNDDDEDDDDEGVDETMRQEILSSLRAELEERVAAEERGAEEGDVQNPKPEAREHVLNEGHSRERNSATTEDAAATNSTTSAAATTSTSAATAATSAVTTSTSAESLRRAAPVGDNDDDDADEETPRFKKRRLSQRQNYRHRSHCDEDHDSDNN